MMMTMWRCCSSRVSRQFRGHRHRSVAVFHRCHLPPHPHIIIIIIVIMSSMLSSCAVVGTSPHAGAGTAVHLGRPGRTSPRGVHDGQPRQPRRPRCQQDHPPLHAWRSSITIDITSRPPAADTADGPRTTDISEGTRNRDSTNWNYLY